MGYRKDFLEKLEGLRCLEFPLGQYVIWGSGPLAIRDLREARDVDVWVRGELWEELAKRHSVEGNVIRIGDVEVWRECMILTPRVDEVMGDCDWIEGLPFMKLEYVVEWKRWLAREKDFKDIELINRWVQENGGVRC